MRVKSCLFVVFDWKAKQGSLGIVVLCLPLLWDEGLVVSSRLEVKIRCIANAKAGLNTIFYA